MTTGNDTEDTDGDMIPMCLLCFAGDTKFDSQNETVLTLYILMFVCYNSFVPVSNFSVLSR